MSRAHGSRDSFVSLSNGRHGLYFIFTAQTDVESCKGSLFQALRITYIVSYFVGFFFLPLLRVGLSGVLARVEDEKASLFLVALFLTNLLYACFL